MFESVATPPRRAAGRWTKIVFAAAIGIPIVCELISNLGHAPGPMIPFFDPTGPVYLDFFNALGIVMALVLLIPGAIAAYKWFGRWTAVAVVVWLALFAWVFTQHVWWS